MPAAESQLAAGLASARELGLKYEEGILLRRRVELRSVTGLEPDPSDIEKSAEILGALGVRPTPSAP